MLNALYGEIATLRDEGRTILLVDQMAELALGIVDRAYVLQSGRIVRSGAAADLRADPELAQAYFGEEPALVHSES
jgi:branched-chain amino acid transport system ATP-binding protein